MINLTIENHRDRWHFFSCFVCREAEHGRAKLIPKRLLVHVDPVATDPALGVLVCQRCVDGLKEALDIDWAEKILAKARGQ